MLDGNDDGLVQDHAANARHDRERGYADPIMMQVLCGDWIEHLKQIPDESVQCCVTSPPYFGLRDYKAKGQVGLEKTPADYIAKLILGFNEVQRVLKKDGTLWVVIGDSYSGSGKARSSGGKGPTSGKQLTNRGAYFAADQPVNYGGLKPKDLIGIPWMFAFAMRDNGGWWLRQDNIWAKPNPMPESVTDRTTRSHEYVFHFSRSKSYYYDYKAIKDPPSPALIQQVEEGYNGKAIKDYLGSSVQDASATKSRIINGCRNRIDKQLGHSRRHAGFNEKWDALTPAEQAMLGRNKRDVWTVPAANYADAHFATFPPELITPCILAGSRIGDTVLDPFAGSGTTGFVALEHGRKSILIELNPEYIPLIQQRCHVTPGML